MCVSDSLVLFLATLMKGVTFHGGIGSPRLHLTQVDHTSIHGISFLAHTVHNWHLFALLNAAQKGLVNILNIIQWNLFSKLSFPNKPFFKNYSENMTTRIWSPSFSFFCVFISNSHAYYFIIMNCSDLYNEIFEHTLKKDNISQIPLIQTTDIIFTFSLNRLIYTPPLF